MSGNKVHLAGISSLFVKIFLSSILCIILPYGCRKSNEIDRFALVNRHNIKNFSFDSLDCLSVGNGEFTFTVDLTGLQTFPEFYEGGIPLGTMSNWGWHTANNPDGFKLSDVYRTYEVHGRKISYVHQFRPYEDPVKAAASEWLRNNPHRIHLGIIGLQILKDDGSEIGMDEIKDPVQDLNLWTGELISRFNVGNIPVEVTTVCHPDKDLISVKIISGLVADNRLRIKMHFPLGVSAPTGYDFNSPDRHSTSVESVSDTSALFKRQQDNDEYYVKVIYSNSRLIAGDKHLFYLEPVAGTVLEFSTLFTPDIPHEKLPAFYETDEASKKSWSEFWSSGGAVDFSQCTDPRASELERRVVLSQYLTRIQCSGALPPAETGLTFNSWYGKFHLEMHWWHAVHFALWQREDILEKQMNYYSTIFDKALKTADNQGYDGVRWPKMVGPDGRESPSTIGTYLIWQQPHIIFFSELLYINSDNKQEILRKYRDLVFSTADFMADYAWYDTIADRYVLGPVLIPAQESLSLESTVNPVFELAYWYWGLKTAQRWRSRLKMEHDPQWADVIEKLSDLPVSNGLYLCSEDSWDSYENQRYLSDHPIVSGISGMLPELKIVDMEFMISTLDTLMKKWNWQSTWGWDFPMMAMSAASVGRSEQAVDLLLMDVPKNRYLKNGHNYQNSRLAIYLPGNGGLLTAVAKMCVEKQFPNSGGWNVKFENLNKYVN